MQKKIAMINDLSGFGRCSLTVALPVLAALKIQCCPLPTAILSNHTGFPVWFFHDLTGEMGAYAAAWERLGLTFDAVATGFLGSENQVRIVSELARKYKEQGSLCFVDPVMGDHGKAYATCTPALCREMKKLAAMGDIITPNLTEACLLTDRTYEEDMGEEKLITLAGELLDLGPEKVVITGIVQGEYFANLTAEKGGEPSFIRFKRAGDSRPGTGDLFFSVMAGAYMGGAPFTEAVHMAGAFVADCIRVSQEQGVPAREGVCFELLLGELTCIAPPESREE